MPRPELGIKRLCPNCGAKYYDLNRDPAICPMCGALFATGAVAAVRPETANEEENDDLETDDEDVELVTLEEADEEETIADAVGDDDIDTGESVDVDTDDAALIDDDDDDDEVSDVVRPTGEDDDDN
ncbi:MAG: TIGR02300 family protein [Pseudomonadota bacterium]